MKKTNIRRIIYKIRHKYLTLNNAVFVIAIIIAIGWIWGSLDVMQRNYKLQKELDDKSRQLIVAQLDVETAKLEQRYYSTFEYQELAVRERLSLVSPGESVLILPPYSEKAKKMNETTADTTEEIITSNFLQWVNFLSGANVKNLDR
jgi:hypothetical protein